MRPFPKLTLTSTHEQQQTSSNFQSGKLPVGNPSFDCNTYPRNNHTNFPQDRMNISNSYNVNTNNSNINKNNNNTNAKRQSSLKMHEITQESVEGRLSSQIQLTRHEAIMRELATMKTEILLLKSEVRALKTTNDVQLSIESSNATDSEQKSIKIERSSEESKCSSSSHQSMIITEDDSEMSMEEYVDYLRSRGKNLYNIAQPNTEKGGIDSILWNDDDDDTYDDL